MSSHDTEWKPDVEYPAPGTPPKNRDQLVQEGPAKGGAGSTDETHFDATRADEPNARAAERGNPSEVPLSPRTEDHVRSPAAIGSDSKQDDVRIGPGDAGASDTPKRSTAPASGYSDGWRVALIILAVVTLGWLMLSFFTAG